MKVDGTLKIVGTLSESVKVTGEGTIELANTTAGTNGTNLVTAAKSGIKNVKVSANAEPENGIVVSSTLTVTVDAGKTLQIEGADENKVLFDVAENGVFKLIGPESGEKPVLKGDQKDDGEGATIQNKGGKLDLFNVAIEGSSGICIESNKSVTTLENVSINATGKKGIGLSANAKDNPDGIGTVSLKDCTITADTDSLGIYLPVKGDVTIDGGSIKGGCAILDKAANLTLTGKLTLTGTNTRNISIPVSKRMVGMEAYVNGTPLIIVDQKNYADGTDVTVTIGENVEFSYEDGSDSNHYDIEIVGVCDTNENEGANLKITYSKITEENLEQENKINPTEIVKDYILDLGEGYKGTITINNHDYKSE